MCSYSFIWPLCKWDLSNIQGTRHTKRNLVNAQESPNNRVSQETLIHSQAQENITFPNSITSRALKKFCW